VNEGWVCPKCGKVLAPWMPECDCYKNQQATTIDNSPYKWQLDVVAHE